MPGFQKQFHLTSGANAGQIRNYVTIVYIGYAVGSALSFFINDRIGRRWSFRLYNAIWVIGQLVATLSPSLPGLYASRIISGLGIGALTVTGPMSIVEIAPAEIRGLLTAWFGVAMGVSIVCANFCVYGVFLHVAESRLQYQIVLFSPCVFVLLSVVASFFICESPRWLMMAGRPDEAIESLVRLRGLPADYPRVAMEIKEIQDSINMARGSDRLDHRPSTVSIIKETFTKSSNLRRVQQSLISYALAQLSGANSITSYFVPIMHILGIGHSTSDNIFLSGMYATAKLGFVLITSFFLVDTLGRRRSLFVGITIQLLTHVYMGVFVKFNQQHRASDAASKVATAALFLHALGYAIGEFLFFFFQPQTTADTARFSNTSFQGLYLLPYIFGGELWPNKIRSFGGALGQTFHWLFIYAMGFGLPSLLEKTNNWGAFIFFAGWCFIALLYVYFMIPETAGMTVEQIDNLFKGPWLGAHRRSARQADAATAEFTGTNPDHKQS